MSSPDSPNTPAQEASPARAQDQAQGHTPETSAADQTDASAPAAKDAPEPKPDSEAPPLPSEPVPDGPPLPNEPTPQPKQEDDGWDFQWDPSSSSYFFYNRFTGQSQWENPRVATSAATDATPAAAAPAAAAAGPQPPASEKPAAGGYNPAIHGDYDPNAWYAQGDEADPAEGEQTIGGAAVPGVPGDPYTTTARFNRFTGQFQTDEDGPGRHTDEAKSKRQMNAFFDVDAAANSHDGRSLKAERSNKKPSKQELKAFKEKRRARKEEKRRAWLRD
ncbi:uncharacterized protein F5Z01DRAFT_459223 [Emericellopsis atlantica]|uniref:WW domain-containing protein n=1 Tax=Emericellopsis atlantica TaxID=2614577 RepID=A0A9P7ZSZ4_9HYPO|nr:uncharacterized protein F5Z01DRAFT_459223 [Emericellopsis atlantica]KAG9257222.1 hypothetical protein F5Z01DRAFT_459223 [Emericellopsis atlantica]